MTRIIVDIPVLENSSGEVESVGFDSHRVGKTIDGVSNVPNYEMDGWDNYQNLLGHKVIRCDLIAIRSVKS